MSLGVVILNWNGVGDTLRCLQSIVAAPLDLTKIDIVVVDNGSKHNEAETISREHPAVDVVRLNQNRGFAGGCNIGAKRALERGADFIVFLNNDTTIPAGVFAELLNAFMNDPAVAIASPMIRVMEKPEQIDFAGARINFAFGNFEHSCEEPKTDRPFDTDYVSGCCLMIRRSVLEEIGFFDESLFAYFEDVDLCLRARERSYRTVCVPTAEILHAGSSSTKRILTQGTTSPLKHYLIARNRTVIVKRYAFLPAKLFYLCVTLPMRTCFYITAFIARGRWQKLRWHLRGVADGVRGKLDSAIVQEITRCE
jgi:GT2 family glycosyltransferase